ncbi:arginase family protein [Novosphingobium sp. APW14]|uniref:arginase family protein n=1 Tax=Novosphingobium sp. APW14 TaxID=3077237 RepID=UPI0028DE23B7|nr:arginase family protein [Novosphingobium sp. APW14]MDT9011845.1 arginase family protein [Novosphingobium sp. APW14]
MITPTFHLIGLPTDCNSSFARGPAAAPAAIRAALWSDRGNLAAEDGQEIGHDFLLEDRGDLPLTETPDDDAIIRNGVTESLSAGAMPILLGGDHAVSFPIVQAIAAKHGPVNILHFDAHPDLYDDFEGNPRSHASPFARILEAGLCRRLVQVGIRTLNRHCREQAARFGVEIVPIADFTPGMVPVLDGPLYISLDLDGLDPSEAPGVSHPEPGGLRVREVLSVLHAQTGQIVGADVVELNPRFDANDRTAILAAKLVREIAATASRNLR